MEVVTEESFLHCILTLGLSFSPAFILTDDFLCKCRRIEAALCHTPRPCLLLEVDIKGELSAKRVVNLATR